MAQQWEVGRHKTTVYNDGTHTCVKYHQTDVVKFNEKEIILDTGGWFTATTKKRMNQASNQFGLGYHVSQMNYGWYCTFDDGPALKFNGNTLEIVR